MNPNEPKKTQNEPFSDFVTEPKMNPNEPKIIQIEPKLNPNEPKKYT